jgi:hypothetical protein
LEVALKKEERASSSFAAPEEKEFANGKTCLPLEPNYHSRNSMRMSITNFPSIIVSSRDGNIFQDIQRVIHLYVSFSTGSRKHGWQAGLLAKPSHRSLKV